MSVFIKKIRTKLLCYIDIDMTIFNSFIMQIYQREGITLNNDFHDFIQLEPISAHLLDAPLFVGPAMDTSLQKRCNDLKSSAERLKELASHDALLLLRVSFSAPKILHILRSSSCTGYTALDLFDDRV